MVTLPPEKYVRDVCVQCTVHVHISTYDEYVKACILLICVLIWQYYDLDWCRICFYTIETVLLQYF